MPPYPHNRKAFFRINNRLSILRFFLGGWWLIPALLLYYGTGSAAVSIPEDEGGVNLVGRFKLRPGLAVESTYDDNINLAAREEIGDFISIISPSCSLEHPLSSRGTATLGYSADYAYYSKYATDNWHTNRLNLNVNYESPGGLILQVSNDFVESEDPYGAANEYGEGERKKRWNNMFNGRIGFDFSNKIKLFGSFFTSTQDYDDDLQDWSQDYETEEYGLSIMLRLMPKTWLFTRYYIGASDYITSSPAGYTGPPVNQGNDADYSWKRINAGLTTDPTSKIRGELNFGFAWKDYKNSADSYGNLYEDKNTWIAETNITYLMSPKTSFSFILSRALWESGSASNEYYESLHLGTGMDHALSRKLTLNASADSRFDDYNTPSSGPARSDERYNFKLGVTYQLNRWFAVSANYRFADKNSNYTSYSYRNNRIAVSFSGGI